MEEGFNPNLFQELSKLESKNFWFRVRNEIILWAIKKYCNNPSSFLEIGCGTGFVTEAIALNFPESNIYGSEYFQEGLEYAKKRLPNATLLQLDARKLPYEDEFFAIGAFDVLEHIKEDCQVLNQIYKALKPNGFLFITIPQHSWLWSPLDEYACHERRYSRKELHHKVRSAGFKIIRSTSFVTMLLPIMLASRLFKKNKTYKDADFLSELKLTPIINLFFLVLLKLDAILIRLGLNLPCGGSRILIAKK